MTPHPSADHHLETRGDTLFFELRRPAKHNALTLSILEGLEQACDALDRREARGLIVTGAGERAFCAGTDLAEASAQDAAAAERRVERARRLLVRIHRSPWTSIAAINGLAYGGGFELALACTFRVAVRTARLALPEIKLGLLPAYAGTQLLPAVVGKARALDLMLTGRPLSADEALAWGAIDRVVDEPARLIPAAEALAASVLAHSQFAIERVRRCVDAAGADVTDAGLAVEGAAVAEVAKSEDAREGALAFLQKRAPKFTHR